MSFVRTLAAVAAGFAAAKGYDKYREMGGMPGVQDALKGNPQTAAMLEQMNRLMGQMGLGGGAPGASPQAGPAGVIAALGGMGAVAATGAAEMFDKMSGTNLATASQEANARLMLKAMIMAARADGEIDADERKVILDHLGDASEEEMAFVQAALAAEVDPMALAAEAGAQMKLQVYSAALMAIVADTEPEHAFLAGLAQALALDAPTVAGLHASLGKPAPKA